MCSKGTPAPTVATELKWNPPQRRLLEVLQVAENRRKSATDICRLAGYANPKHLNIALLDPRFIAAVEALGLKVRREQLETRSVVRLLSTDGWTNAQERFLDALDREPRRPLTRTELCRLAGYDYGADPLHKALEDASFVDALEARGMSVRPFVEDRERRREQGLTNRESRLLAIIEQEEHRWKAVSEICSLAGYKGHGTWHAVMRNPRFASRVHELRGMLPRDAERRWPLGQLRFLELLRDEENRSKPAIELCRMLGYSDSQHYYRHLRDPRFVAELEELGVPIDRRTDHGVAHTDVGRATDLEAELRAEVWDIRRLQMEYPKHGVPSDFRVDFRRIENPVVREQVKMYFRTRLCGRGCWLGRTFSIHLSAILQVVKLLPQGMDLGMVRREHVEALLPDMLALSDNWTRRCLSTTKAMLNHMATSRSWSGVRTEKDLIWAEDIPSRSEGNPRPIPPDVIPRLDALIERARVDMEAGLEPPLLKREFWNGIMILRRTGMRFEDLAHLIAPGSASGKGCLEQDGEGSWWVVVRPDNEKTHRERRIPTLESDGVIAAIRRQQALVADVPDRFGQDYLFRTVRGVLTFSTFRDALTRLGKELMHEGHPYPISPHQFRHTLATDMAQRGVDIYIIKEILGHTSIAMTERYIKLYKKTLKDRYDDYTASRGPTGATALVAAYRGGGHASSGISVARRVRDRHGDSLRSPLPDGEGICYHQAENDPCPTPPVCATCARLQATKRHLPYWAAVVADLRTTVETLADDPRSARAWRRCAQELAHAEYMIATIEREGHWNGRIHNAGAPRSLVSLGAHPGGAMQAERAG